ncbi:hypothetical protein NP233_g7523 [Leucocoprinus birnbaumii]|uniref:Uncharacterized protein n=1 Tax=Leucocoprinus birnbaumii TaxID=56174 RepID=A0AAD5VP62_9AGAR|nr:hypothetical protein NP233_g7523 [Leucocoprinus birnbaumii]
MDIWHKLPYTRRIFVHPEMDPTECDDRMIERMNTSLNQEPNMASISGILFGYACNRPQVVRIPYEWTVPLGSGVTNPSPLVEELRTDFWLDVHDQPEVYQVRDPSTSWTLITSELIVVRNRYLETLRLMPENPILNDIGEGKLCLSGNILVIKVSEDYRVIGLSEEDIEEVMNALKSYAASLKRCKLTLCCPRAAVLKLMQQPRCPFQVQPVPLPSMAYSRASSCLSVVDIFETIIDLCDFEAQCKLLRASGFTRELVQAVISRRIRRVITPYVGEKIGVFFDMLHKTQSLISGSTALYALAPYLFKPDWKAGDINILAPSHMATAFAGFLLHDLEYTVIAGESVRSNYKSVLNIFVLEKQVGIANYSVSEPDEVGSFSADGCTIYSPNECDIVYPFILSIPEDAGQRFNDTRHLCTKCK